MDRKQQEFIAVLKSHQSIPENQIKVFLQSQGFVETNLNQGQIEVWSFRGSNLDLSFKKAGLESETIKHHLTLIDIGLAPEDFPLKREQINCSLEKILAQTKT